MTNEFEAWVEQLVRDHFGTMTKLADAVGMRLSPFGRAVRTGTLSFRNLLKIAIVAGEDPLTVLRMANKREEADLLEQLYGPRAHGAARLTGSQRELLALLDRLPPGVRSKLLGLARELDHDEKSRKSA